jgi:hypothetical protein
LEHMLPMLLEGSNTTWRVHGYKGVGRLPANLGASVDPKKETLLDKLPNLLRGFGRTPGIDAIVIVVDVDNKDCVEFLAELNAVWAATNPAPVTLFRLAIEEMEAWYFGDPAAIKSAYPNAKAAILSSYQNDSICGTWEMLADAIVAGGAAKLKSEGWPASGIAKSEWAERITPHMNPNLNVSPSFIKFRDGIRRLAQ